MPKKAISKSSRKRSSGKPTDLTRPGTTNRKGTRLGRALVDGMTQVLSHVRGEIELKSYTLPGPIDVKAIRKKVGMSQSEFASAFALNRRTLQEWEQGKTAPDNAVRAYLTVIDRNPEAVVEALRH
jgi:putative transcriptional regulator